MIADFDFYKNTYKGIRFTTKDEYEYFAERAGDELAPFEKHPKLQTSEAQNALRKCACAVADILYGYDKLSKYGVDGGKINSESVSGYYSVSYGGDSGSNGVSAKAKEINRAIAKYLGKYILTPQKYIKV